MFIFSKFLTFFSKIGKIVIRLDISSYTAIINAIQTPVIDQFIALKNRKKQTKIKLCSVVGYYRFILFDRSRILIECSVNGFYSLIIINYGTTYNLSFW